MVFIESVGVLLPAPGPTSPEEVASAPDWEGCDANTDGFGRWLATLRRNANLTQKQLGAASGHINVYISKIENGVVKPRPDVARGICLALGVSDALWEQVRAHFFAPADVTLANYSADAVGFGRWMAALRRNVGVTQERLGAASGHINVYISKIENGAMPSVFIAYGLCVALDVRPELRDEGLRWFYGDRLRLLSTDTRDHLAFGFGSWLAALRHNAAMTQEGLASATGYQPGYISEIENGDFVPRRRIARDLCVAMGASAALVEESLSLFDEYRLIDAIADNHTLASWLRAHLHNADLNRTELATAAGLSRWYVREIARGESTPLLGTFRRLCDALDVHGPARFDAVRCFYGDRYSISADPDEERDFWRLVDISVDSRQEEEQRNRIYERYDYDRIAKDAARRWARTRGDRDDLEQVARTAILKAMGHHTPTAPFIAHAVASARGAVRSFYFEHRYLGLEPRTRRIVVVVRAYLGGVDSARPTADAAEIASALRLNRADVTEALQILSQRSVSLDEPVAGRHGGDIQREVADPTATAAFEDTDLVDSVRAALAGLPEPDTATRLVLAHWVEGTPLDQAAPQLGLSAQAAAEVIAAAVPLLRTAFQPPSSDHAATPDDAHGPSGQDAAPAIAEHVLEAQVLGAGVLHAPGRVRLVGRRIGFDQWSAMVVAASYGRVAVLQELRDLLLHEWRRIELAVECPQSSPADMAIRVGRVTPAAGASEPSDIGWVIHCGSGYQGSGGWPVHRHIQDGIIGRHGTAFELRQYCAGRLTSWVVADSVASTGSAVVCTGADDWSWDNRSTTSRSVGGDPFSFVAHAAVISPRAGFAKILGTATASCLQQSGSWRTRDTHWEHASRDDFRAAYSRAVGSGTPDAHRDLFRMMLYAVKAALSQTHVSPQYVTPFGPRSSGNGGPYRSVTKAVDFSWAESLHQNNLNHGYLGVSTQVAGPVQLAKSIEVHADSIVVLVATEYSFGATAVVLRIIRPPVVCVDGVIQTAA